MVIGRIALNAYDKKTLACRGDTVVLCAYHLIADTVTSTLELPYNSVEYHFTRRLHLLHILYYKVSGCRRAHQLCKGTCKLGRFTNDSLTCRLEICTGWTTNYYISAAKQIPYVLISAY